MSGTRSSTTTSTATTKTPPLQETKPLGSSAPKDSDDKKSEKSLGLKGKAILAWGLYKNSDKLEQSLKTIKNLIQLIKPKIAGLAEIMQSAYGTHQDTTKEAIDSKWQIFFKGVSTAFNKVTQLTDNLHESDKIEERIHDLVIATENVTVTADALDIEAMAEQFIPQSAEHLKEQYQKLANELINKSLGKEFNTSAVSFYEKIDKLFEEHAKALDEQLKKKDQPSETKDQTPETKDQTTEKIILQIEQDIYLVSMAFMLDIYKELFLSLDKLELQLGAKEGSLSGIITSPSKQETPGQHTTSFSSTIDLVKTLTGKTKEHTERFKKCMELGGYKEIIDAYIDLYPYKKSITQQRTDLIKKIDSQTRESRIILNKNRLETKTKSQTIITDLLTKVKDDSHSKERKSSIDAAITSEDSHNTREKFAIQAAFDLIKEYLGLQKENSTELLKKLKDTLPALTFTPQFITSLSSSSSANDDIDKELSEAKLLHETVSKTLEEAEKLTEKAIINSDDSTKTAFKKIICNPYEDYRKEAHKLVSLIAEKKFIQGRIEQKPEAPLVTENSLSHDNKSQDNNPKKLSPLDDFLAAIKNVWNATEELKKTSLKESTITLEYVENKINELKGKIKEHIDPKIYGDYIAENHKKSPDKTTHPFHWIQHTGIILRNIDKLIFNIKTLKQPASNTPASNTTPLSNLTDHINRTADLERAFNELFISADQLTTIWGEEIVPALWKKGMEIVQDAEKITNSYSAENIFPQKIDGQNGLLSEDKKIESKEKNTTSLKEDIIEGTERILAHTSLSKDAHPIASNSTEKLGNFLSDWKKLFDDKTAPPGALAKTTWLFTNLFTISSSAAIVTNLLSVIKPAVSTEMIIRANELNSFFRQLYLYIDKVSLELFLNEEVIREKISLIKIIPEKLNLIADKLGYKFTEEHYPYRNSILTQREELLGKLPKTDDKSLDEKHTPKPQNPNKQVIEINRNFYQRKIDEISPPKSKSPQDNIESKDSKSAEDKTNETNKKLRDESILLIDIEIDNLKQQRGNTYYIFKHSRRKSLEDRIIACQELKEAMKYEGFDSNSAFEKLEEKFPPLTTFDKFCKLQTQHLVVTEVLTTYEQNLLKKISSLFANNPSLKEEKRLVNDLLTSAIQSTLSVSTEIQDTKSSSIDSKLSARISALNKSWFQTFYNVQKRKLLTELKDELKNKNLTQALHEIHKKNLKTYYLLFDGKTGVMMKEIQYSNLPKEEMINRIDREIAKLENQINEGFYFFSQYRTSVRRGYIEKLTLFQGELNKKEMKKAIQDHRNQLKKVAPELLQDLDLWCREHPEEKKDAQRPLSPS